MIISDTHAFTNNKTISILKDMYLLNKHQIAAIKTK